MPWVVILEEVRQVFSVGPSSKQSYFPQLRLDLDPSNEPQVTRAATYV